MSSRASDLASARPLARARPWVRRVTTGTTAAGLLLLGIPPAGHQGGAADDAVAAPRDRVSLVSSHHRTHRWRGHPGRYLRHYTVRRGDTATGLAVRFHAWTAELIALNRLSSHARLYVGQRIRIPVVAAAARRARHHRAHRHHAHRHHARRHHRAGRRAHPAHRHRAHHRRAHHRRPTPLRPAAGRGWRPRHASRATVRRVVVRTARRYHVPDRLALAIAWQESGWRHRRVSSAGAIGVMQVMPDTGRWMSLLVGHRLSLRRLRENVTAGVLLIRVLRSQAPPRRAIAAYYQGLGSVRRHGLYPSTRRYVANVRAVRARLARGWEPT